MIIGNVLSKRYAAISVFFSLALLVFFLSGNLWAKSKAPIKLGSLTDLTGPASSMVVAMDAWGFKDYFDWVNQTKGGIEGHPVECSVVDTGYKMDKIKSGYEILLDKNILAMMCSLSPALEGLKSRFEKDKIVVMSGTANTPSMWPAGYVYQCWPTYADCAGFIVDRIIEQVSAKRDIKSKPVRLAWLYANNPMGMAILPAKAYAEARGCQNVADEGEPMVPTNTVTELRRIAGSKADAIIVGVLPAAMIINLKDAVRIGLSIPFYATLMTKLDGVIHYGGISLAPGFYGMDTTGLWYPQYEAKSTAVKVAMQILRKKHPEGLTEPWKFFDGWQKAMILEEGLRNAIKAKGWPITRQDVKDGVDSLKDFNMQSINANVTMHAGIDNRGTVKCKFYKVEKKQKGLATSAVIVEKSDWISAPTVLPAKYETKCVGLKELCKKNGWTYFSPESGLIIGK